MGALTLLGVLLWTRTWTANSTSFFGHFNFRQFFSSLLLEKNILKSTIWCQVNNLIFFLYLSCQCDFLRAGCTWAGFSCFEWYLFDFNRFLNLASFSLFFYLLFSLLPPISPWDWMLLGATVPASTLSASLGFSGASPLFLLLCDLSFWSQDTGFFLQNNSFYKDAGFHHVLLWTAQLYQTAQPFLIVWSQ